MKKGQANRLTTQQKAGGGPATIFNKNAQIHDKEVKDISLVVMEQLKSKYHMLEFRHRTRLTKKQINDALQKIDKSLGQTLYVPGARIQPDGGLIEVKDDKGNWRVVLVSEAKRQGKDIENIRAENLSAKRRIRIL